MSKECQGARIVKILQRENSHALERAQSAAFHAEYGEYSASISLDGDVLRGYLPVKQKRLVLAWLEIHREELFENWTRAEKGEKLCSIDPLK